MKLSFGWGSESFDRDGDDVYKQKKVPRDMRTQQKKQGF